MSENQSRGRGRSMLGFVLVAMGILFMLSQVFDLNVGRYMWPFFVILPGVLFFVGMFLGGKQAGPLAIPGTIVTTVGLLLLYQNTFNHWASWSYAWALIFPTSLGVGLMINGGWSDNQKLAKHGAQLAGIGVAMFVVMGFLMELVFNVSGNIAGNVFWPILLIGAGVYFLTKQRRSARVEEKYHSPPAAVNGKVVEKAPPKVEPAFEPLDMTRNKN